MHRSLGTRIVRILLKTVLFLLIFFVLLVLAIQTAPVQDFLRGKAVTWLEKKLNTKVAVGKIYIGFPKDVVIENIYLEDRQKDTLLSGGKIKVDIGLFKLISGKVEVNDLFLGDLTVKVKRQLPDTTFNFQFIVDAFSSKASAKKASRPDTINKLSVNKVTLDKIRLVYQDVITGNDVLTHLDHFETRISLLDLVHKRFDISSFKIDGLSAKVYQSKPLVKSEPESKDLADAKEPIPYQVNFKEVDLEKIDLDYRNDVSSFYFNLALQKLLVHPDKIDLATRVIDLDDLILQGTTATVRLGKSQGAKVVAKEARQEAKSQTESGWKINVASLTLDKNHIRFDNDNQEPVNKGIDYAHLDADNFTLHVDNFYFAKDSISGKIKEGTVQEKNNLDLKDFKTDFVYGVHGASLKNLHIQTAGTEIQQGLEIKYASLQDLKDHPGNTELHIDLNKSKIQVKDILTFVPSLAKQAILSNPSASLSVNSRIDGKVSDLKIGELNLSGLGNTVVDLSGTIGSLPDAKNVNANLTIRKFHSTRKDISLFVPVSSFPKTITIPENFDLSGRINGGQDNLTTNLLLKTSLGSITISGTAKNITDKIKAKYNVSLGATELQLGTLLQKKEMLGALTADFKISGSGLDKKTANATIDGMIHSVALKQYEYRELKIKAGIARQVINLTAGITDPNIHVFVDASANLSAGYPAVKLHALIDSIKTQNLHLSAGNIVYRGDIIADFPFTNPDSLQGKVFITHSLLVKDAQRIQMDTVQLLAGRNGADGYLTLNSDVVNASLKGRYKLTELGKIFQQSIQPYFTVNENDSIATKTPYDFTITADVMNKPVLKALMPSLERMDSVSLTGHFASGSGWNALLKAPLVIVGTNTIKNLVITAGTGRGNLAISATLDQFTSGKSLALYNSAVHARIKDDRINFSVNIKDKLAKEKYNLAGLFEQPQKNNYRFSLDPDSLLLNYDRWVIAAGNKIDITKTNVLAANFNLDKNGEHLGLNSDSTAEGSPLQVSFSNFKLETLTAFIQPDSSLAGGVLNGSALVSDIMKQPVFTGDLTITDLNIKNDTVGNVKLRVNNKTANTYNADIAISGRGNDVTLKGNYYAGQPDNNFDFLLALNQLPMTTVQAFSQGNLTQASGSLNGKFALKGSLKDPKINGDLNFLQAAFKPAQLNNRFLIDNDKIVVDEQGIRFDQFAIKDSANNELTLNGTAATTNFKNYNFDLTVRSNNFQALNSTKKDSKLFYGQLFFNSNLNVKGTEAAPVIDGRITINDKTKLTIVLPQKEPGVAERDGVIEFVDMDSPANDSLFLKPFDTLNTFAMKGLDLAANIEIKKEAELNLIVDQGSGDFLNVRGEALLTAGVDPSGKITLAGSYELEDGAYQLTFNLLRRKFNIVKGSKIVWGGEPTQADVSITAAYETSTAPLDLVKNQLGPDVSESERNTYLQKLPFQVYLKMNGKLLQPVITFDIVLPEDKEYNVSADIVSTVRTKLELLRQEEGELNKQVFALLLLNRFVGENPFNSSGSGATAETLIRQSASKLLTEQLNRLAESLVQGVDLNFDVESSDDYTTGERKDRTDLNVGLSKRLLNDRLTVTVGSNFELEGVQNSNRSSNNIAGNVALNYRLSKDGRYVLRAYRKNEYQGVIDGYIIETGVGFIITVDYNRFREIFKKKKARQPRNQREKAKSSTQTAASGTNPSNF